MVQNRIYLSTPHLSGFEQEYMFNSDNWLNVNGENLDEFEMKLEDYLGEDVRIAALSSGTAAIHLALVLLDVKYGDEVICQTMTFSASANPITYLGATPVFVDSESETWNICPLTLEEAIKDRIKKGKKPKAIIAVHLYGMPFKYDEIRDVSDKYEIPLIEDSAEALGSVYKTKRCGTLGDIGVISFNGNKIITTSGGGALVLKSKELKNKAVFLSTQARDEAPYYQHSVVGYNYRMNNINAGIGLGQMKVLGQYVALRREMNLFYQKCIEGVEDVVLFKEPSVDYYSNHWLSAILLGTFEQREALRLIFEKKNIETRPLWKPMHLQPVFTSAPYYGGNIAESLFEKGLCLPSGSNLNEEEKNRIKAALEVFF